MSVSIIVNGSSLVVIDKDGKVSLDVGEMKWTGDTLQINSTSGFSGGGGVTITNHAPGGIAGNNIVGGRVNNCYGRNSVASSSGIINVNRGGKRSHSIMSFSGGTVVFSDGTSYTCGPGSNMNLINGEVYVDGKKVKIQHQKAKELPKPEPVSIPTGKVVGNINVSGSAVLEIEEGAPIHELVYIELNGIAEMIMRKPENTVSVETHGSSKFTCVGVPANIHAESSGCSSINIGK